MVIKDNRQSNTILNDTTMTTVSKTEEGELLVYKEDGKGGFINLIISGDIEIFHIKGDRDKSFNKVGASVDEAVDFWNQN